MFKVTYMVSFYNFIFLASHQLAKPDVKNTSPPHTHTLNLIRTENHELHLRVSCTNTRVSFHLDKYINVISRYKYLTLQILQSCVFTSITVTLVFTPNSFQAADNGSVLQ